MNIEEYISSGIIESYILGFASPEEAGFLECVMKNNAAVKSAFEEAQKTLEDLATVQAIAPPENLENKIWTKIQEETKITDIRPHISEKQDTESGEITQKIYPNKSANWQKYAIAASVLFLVSIAGNLFWMNDNSKHKEEIALLVTQKKTQDLALQNSQERLAVLSNPNIITIPLKGVEKHLDSQAVVYWDQDSKNVYLNAENLPQAPEGMQYQLWALVDGKPVSAGIYTSDKNTRTILANIPKAQAFAITLEKQGGSESPTMENMYVMGTI